MIRPGLAAAFALPLVTTACQPPSEGRIDDDDDDSWVSDDDVSDDDAADDDAASSFGIDSTGVGPGFLLEPYSALLLVTGSPEEPVGFGVTSGSLPPGLDLADDGLIDGAPTDFGTFKVQVTATDGAEEQVTADLVIEVGYDGERLFLGAVPEDGEYNNMCGGGAMLDQMCHPWVRLVGAGVEDQVERALLPALWHVGPDGQPDDLLDGFGDDILVRTLDPLSVLWSFEALVGETDHNIDVSPVDAGITAEGVLQAGEETGPGVVRVESDEWGSGEAPAHVIPPDWCEPDC